MATEAIYKLQPTRTLALGGFDRRGAAAAMHSASDTGFTVSGVFRDFADAAVVQLWDADNQYEHYSIRYLPDFDFTGMKLTFDLKYNGQLQGIESSKNPWVAWNTLSFSTGKDGYNPGTASLFDNAMLQSGSFTPASTTFNLYGAGATGDKMYFYYLNTPFGVTISGPAASGPFVFWWQGNGAYAHYISIYADDASFSASYAVAEAVCGNGTGAASSITYQINSDPSCPLQAVWDGSNGVTIKPKTMDGKGYTIMASDGNGTGTLTNADPGSPAGCAAEVARQINNYNWPYENPAMAITAEASGADLTIYAARFGMVDVDGTSVTWASGMKFPGIAVGAPIYLYGRKYTVATVDSPTSLTIAENPSMAGRCRYLTRTGGVDGNLISIQMRSTGGWATTGSSVMNTTVFQNIQTLTGGSSDVTWRITLDFDTLKWTNWATMPQTGLTNVRTMWLTLAPALDKAAAYTDTEFTAEFTNWTVTDPSNHRPLKVAGPGSVRVGSRNDWVSYTGATPNTKPYGDWAEESGWYWGGYARTTSTVGDKVTVKYSCQSTHNLYLGTSLFWGSALVSVTLDGQPLDDVSCLLDAEPPIIGRRLLTTNVAAGDHVVVITHKQWNKFVFDYLEAAVLSDVPDPVGVVTDASPALDWDTDATYKMPPARLVWQLDKLGLRGDINEYLGVFWYNQRKRINGTNRVYNIQLGGTWAAADELTVTLSGLAARKTLQALDVADGNAAAIKVLARSIVDRLNTTFSGVWAEVTGAALDTITIHPRTAMFWFTKTAVQTVGTGGTITETGSLDPGSEGVWVVDPAQTPALNKAARDWHADMFSLVHAKGWNMCVSVSMELLNPPEDASNVYAARFSNGIQVLTSTGFGTEAQATITGATNASPIVITAEGHGYSSGDSVVVSDVVGNTAANNDKDGITAPAAWTVTRIDADRFSLNGTTGNGAFVPWTATSGLQIPKVLRNLHTTHCAFVSKVTAYQKEVYKCVAGLMNAAGLTPWLQFGEFLWWFFSYSQKAITGATTATPVVLTVPGHGLTTGQRVIASGVKGNTAANGTWTVTVVDADHFSLNGSVGRGNYQAGSGLVSGWGMAFYDAETAAAATSTLGRALATFYTQDDDPTVNSSADANFLAARLKAHVDAIRSYVVTSYAGAKFELLYPCDVTFSPCYHTVDFPWPQGGRLNSVVNLPSAWQVKAGSGLDRLKIEALSWGSTYRNMDNAKAAIKFPFTSPCNWPKADVRYLIPLFNGGCPWVAEYHFARNQGIPALNFWALDHFALLSWPLPLPASIKTAELL